MTTFISRRTALKSTALAGLSISMPAIPSFAAKDSACVAAVGNPFIPFRGVADPQIRVYDNVIYMYATHDASFSNDNFVMHDWWVWRSTDLVAWERVCYLRPDQTYFGKPSTDCWATDAARRDGRFYFYFSMGPKNIGVVVGESPAGPWHDPLHKPLIAEGLVPTESRDPGILQEEDGTSYIVFGTWDYYIARLNENMVSLAEMPKLLEIRNKEGPYGAGKTDDKPFLHRRGDIYYLSWGSFYAMSYSPYGPFDCKGSLITRGMTEAKFRDETNFTGRLAPPPQYRPKDSLNYDRHGSFFELYGQWYFAYNDHALPGTKVVYRNPMLSYVHYKDDGQIAPLRVDSVGVGQYDARSPIQAADFFKVVGAVIRETSNGRFDVCDMRSGSYLLYPKIRNLLPAPKLTIDAKVISGLHAELEVRRQDPHGELLGKINLSASDVGSSVAIQLATKRSVENLCLVVVCNDSTMVNFRSFTFGLGLYRQ
jgi:arabinoxylan arabinofuranohydrolase